MTWDIFIGITLIIGFIISVTTPIVKFTKIINALSGNLSAFKETLSTLTVENTAAHKEIWEELDKINEKVSEVSVNFEKRLLTLELRQEFYHGSPPKIQERG